MTSRRTFLLSTVAAWLCPPVRRLPVRLGTLVYCDGFWVTEEMARRYAAMRGGR